MQTGALLVACAAIVAVGCSGRTERPRSDTSSGGASAGQGGESAGDSGASEACDVTDGDSCSSGESRCCTGPTGDTCVPIDWDNCTGCNERCDLLVSNSCVDGTCVCGDEPACSGKTPFCDQGSCVECIGNADCFDSKGFGAKCLEGACAECDPKDVFGCSEKRLVCSNEGKCEPCSEERACRQGLLCDPESGYCKVCVEDSDCFQTTLSICVEYTDQLSECQACSTDEQCAERDPKRGKCVNPGDPSAECLECDPTNDAGCDEDEECLTVFGGDGSVLFECRNCVDDADCDDWDTPLCDTERHTCVPCNDPSIEFPHARCDDEGEWACITVGEDEGKCGHCDPASDTGCYPAAPRCDPEEGSKGGPVCRECLGIEDCPDGFECSPGHECVGCTSDSQCENSAAGTQCVDITGGKGCRPCDPFDNAGCPPQEKCSQSFVCGPP